jgi:iron complex transport system substrate-binding protein
VTVASGPLSAPTQLTIAKAPKRIISLSPSATETLYAIDAGSQVTAVDSDSDYPANAPRTNLSGYTPNVEAILGRQPDLVIAAEDTNNLVAGLKKVGVPTLLLPAPTGLTEAYSQMQRLGAATGHVAQAAALVTQTKQRIATAVAKAGSADKHLTYYYELDPTYYTVTSASFIGQMCAQFGMTSIADATHSSDGYPQLSAEFIVAANPDLIILADGPNAGGVTVAAVGKRAGWAGMSAVQNHHVIVIDADIASRWGPRIADFAEQISAEVSTVAGH